jgi:hypothetical protein
MIAAQIWVWRRRILRPAASLDWTGFEARLDGGVAPRGQGVARRVFASGGMDRQTLRDRAKPAKGSGRRSLLEWPAEGYLFGVFCPARGTGAALVMPTVHRRHEQAPKTDV